MDCTLYVLIMMYMYTVHVNFLGCAVLLCLVVCLTLLASFFLPSASLIKTIMFVKISFSDLSGGCWVGTVMSVF